MKIRRETIPGGTLWLHEEDAGAAAVEDFVRSEAFRNIPAERRVAVSSRRNFVFDFEIPGVGRCILKDFFVDRRHGALRAAESAFKLRFVHRGLRTFRLLGDIRALGIRVSVPLAFWTGHGPDGPHNYLLYRYLDGVPVGSVWMGRFARPGYGDGSFPPGVLHAYMEQLGTLVRTLHEGGILHTDLHPGNVIAPRPLDGTGPLGLIDMDSAYRPFAPGRRALFTARVKSIRRLADCFDDLGQDDFLAFLRAYARGDESLVRSLLPPLRFWRSRMKADRRISSVLAWFRFPPPRG